MNKTTQTSPSLGDRMKAYEHVSSSDFTKRTPLIIRLDGKAFHTWTKNLDRPFDPRLPTMFAACIVDMMKEMQGAVFAYGQSDEISFLLRDYDRVETEAWFGANQQKIVSVASSLLTAKFNFLASKLVPEAPLALFDARAFILPKDEVVNYFIFRQQDAIRNSIQGHAQALLGHKACQGLNTMKLREAIADKYPDNKWEDLKLLFQRGYMMTADRIDVDFEIPLFKDNRSCIEKFVYIEKEIN